MPSVFVWQYSMVSFGFLLIKTSVVTLLTRFLILSFAGNSNSRKPTSEFSLTSPSGITLYIRFIQKHLVLYCKLIHIQHKEKPKQHCHPWISEYHNTTSSYDQCWSKQLLTEMVTAHNGKSMLLHSHQIFYSTTLQLDDSSHYKVQGCIYTGIMGSKPTSRMMMYVL